MGKNVRLKIPNSLLVRLELHREENGGSLREQIRLIVARKCDKQILYTEKTTSVVITCSDETHAALMALGDKRHEWVAGRVEYWIASGTKCKTYKHRFGKQWRGGNWKGGTKGNPNPFPVWRWNGINRIVKVADAVFNTEVTVTQAEWLFNWLGKAKITEEMIGEFCLLLQRFNITERFPHGVPQGYIDYLHRNGIPLVDHTETIFQEWKQLALIESYGDSGM